MKITILIMLLLNALPLFAAGHPLTNWEKKIFGNVDKIIATTVPSLSTINAINEAIANAIYWEDQGYEYQMIEQDENFLFTFTFKKNGKPVGLYGVANVQGGGFGWFPGYKKFNHVCDVYLKITSSDFYVDCERTTENDDNK